MAAQTDFIRSAILDLILAGELGPGDAIHEKEICERFQSSRTPFREAILQLEAMNVVERRPRLGAYVKYPPFRELVERVEMHAELEGSMAALAARRANRQQALELKQLVKDYQVAAESVNRGENPDIYNLNLKLHDQIFLASGNRSMHAQIQLSGLILVGFFRARHSVISHIRKSAVEHQQMVEAVLDADVSRARDITYRHVVMDAEELLDVANILASR